MVARCLASDFEPGLFLISGHGAGSYSRVPLLISGHGAGSHSRVHIFLIGRASRKSIPSPDTRTLDPCAAPVRGPVEKLGRTDGRFRRERLLSPFLLETTHGLVPIGDSGRVLIVTSV